MSNDQIVAITGAAGGLGAETAKAFLAVGARLALIDRDAAALATLADQLTPLASRPDAVRTYPADVTDEDSVVAYYSAIGRDLGPLATLFNNAGIEGAVRPVMDYPTEDFDRVMAINVRGVWLNMKYALKAMQAAGTSGAVINTASGAALVGNRDSAPYAASKHAVLGLTRSAALEVAADGIRVNAICPGPVDTRMMRSIEEQQGKPGDAAHQAIVASIPARRYGTAAEIAKLVVFLASDDARYINGAGIAIDGGLTAQ